MYKELNVEKMEDIISDVRLDKPLDFDMVTVLCQRIEISDPKYVKALKSAFIQLINTHETEGFDDKQMGFYVFKTIFEKGLDAFVELPSPKGVGFY